MLEGEGGEQEGKCGEKGSDRGRNWKETKRTPQEAMETSSENLGCKLCGLCACEMASYTKFLQVHIILLLFTLNLLGLHVMDNPHYWGF